MDTVGFVPEPNCGRGTASIIWGCLATIFFVVWTALHIDYRESVPRVFWGASVFFMPEAMPAGAIQQFVLARRLQRQLNNIRGWGSWSLEQSFLVVKNGVKDKGSGEILTADRLVELADHDQQKHYVGIHIDMLPQKEDIAKRSKKSCFEKVIAGGQALWFSTNVMSRLVGGYQVTLVEDLTMAYACCGLIATVAWFCCPQDIEDPFEIDLKGIGNLTKQVESRLCALHLCSLQIVGNKCLSRLVILGFIMVTAIHLAAWQYPFPTAAEAWVWRACALVTLPLGFLLVYFRDKNTLLMSSTGFVLARLTLWVVACAAFRRMPISAFDTPNWSDYWGHIGK